jgi:hypothetical protein
MRLFLGEKLAEARLRSQSTEEHALRVQSSALIGSGLNPFPLG